MKRLKRCLKSRLFWFLLIIVLILIKLISGYFSSTVKYYAIEVSEEYVSNIINDVFSSNIMAYDNMMKQVINNDGDVIYSSLDASKANEIRCEASNKIMDAIKDINNHSDFEFIEIPIGYFFSKNMFLSDGIRVPISLDVVGSHNIEVKAEAYSYGINSSLVEIYLDISINILVYIPFIDDKFVSNHKIPLSIEIINSAIPDTFFM